ncbi:hypothetical protein CAOG_01774 [Capsaspora owczarzaki ATCC 30864]|uniref:DNA polymerase alpha subunit B n=1 Tax=Capsaspora owczarzaki (strain ATCC 30864) TaxID=595528 RepID=A0A0D2X1A4_CAPO3|nr:hypothetical protein CAOG_01774 [Capsaspora owczarzaki ATCC 30864]KJE90464.1 hypothetical protein CAOG_001774 [Capsaspora owczarzaki ATCC 30864]|eukprot:XP_004364642.2 hypothetical protein CAOG_01774 [Capsaspora owczarzaki ATCC 30864]
MATTSEIISEFADIGQKLSDDLVAQCLTICNRFDVSAETLAAKWEAFASASDSSRRLGADDLASLQKQLQDQERQQQNQRSATKKRPANAPIPTTVSPAKVDLASTTFDKRTVHIVDESILSLYGMSDQMSSRSSKDTPNKRPFGTPPPNRVSDTIGSPLLLSPTSLSPTRNLPSKAFSERSNAGKVEFILNEALPPWRRPANAGPRTIDMGMFESCQLTPYRFMLQKVTDKAEVLDQKIEELGALIRKQQLPNAPASFDHVGLAKQAMATVAGRICSDAGNGKLNDVSILLEGSRDVCNGVRIPLDMRSLDHFSAFPGQIVVAQGYNITGTKFSVQPHSFFTSAPKPMQQTETAQLLDYWAPYRSGNRPLSIVAAAGPFSGTDDLSFAPLMELATQVGNSEPDVLILMGPFVDEQHPGVAAGELDVTFEDLFREAVNDTVHKLLNSYSGLHIVIVPSLRDVVHDKIMPQPPFPEELVQPHERLMLCSNPGTFVINEVTIGIITSDILFHLSSEETARARAGDTSDRLARLAGHLLDQRSFYPLFPPALGTNTELTHRKQLDLPVTPDVLILPSDLKFFAKIVQQTVCVNPGRLTRDKTGGTYAKLTVFPPREEDVPAGMNTVLHHVARRTRAEIVRI